MADGVCATEIKLNGFLMNPVFFDTLRLKIRELDLVPGVTISSNQFGCARHMRTIEYSNMAFLLLKTTELIDILIIAAQGRKRIMPMKNIVNA